jgi:hypothetical protein
MDNARNYALRKIEPPDASLSLSEVIAFTNRQMVATIAHKLISGNISVIEAARQISAFHGKSFGMDESNPDFVTFLAIDRETDRRLFAESLQNWARPYSLARKDAVVARCEEAQRSDALRAAVRLVTGFAEEQAA